MENSKCSDDNFDAVYICSCTKMFCIKCYFSHIKKSPDHEIRRIRIPVNNESRHILINFVVTLKQKLFLCMKPHIENQKFIISCNILLKALNNVILVLIKSQFIPMKHFFNHWEYLLYQTPDKASNYTTNFKIPERFEDFISESFITEFLFFNYFKFENPNYIFGWIYSQFDSNKSLEKLYFVLTWWFLVISEYEMAYEILQSFIGLYWTVGEDWKILDGLAKIIYDFIIHKDISNAIKLWKKEESLPLLMNSSEVSFYSLSEVMFASLHQNDLVSLCQQKIKMIIRSVCFDKGKWYLLAWYNLNKKNDEKAKKYFIKFVKQHKNPSDPTIFELLISSYLYLISYYSDHKKLDKVKKIIKAVRKISFDKNLENHSVLFSFYLEIKDYDNIYKLSIELIRKNKKKGINTSKELFLAYLFLGWIHFKKGNFKKAHQVFYCAKSSSGILPMSDPIIKGIYSSLALFYLAVDYWKDALAYFESIIDYVYDKSLLNAKYGIGLANYYIGNYEKELQILIEIEESLCLLPDADKRMLLEFYEAVGQIYDLRNDTEKADFYFCKVFELMSDLGNVNGYTYDYFFNKSDYKNCDEILQMGKNLLESHDDSKSKFKLFLLPSKQFLLKNEIEESEEYLDKAEKLFKKMPPLSKRKVHCEFIEDLLLLAKLYLLKLNMSNAEKRLETAESLLDINLPSYFKLDFRIFEILKNIDIKQDIWEEGAIYNNELINMLKNTNKSEICSHRLGYNEAYVESQIKDAKTIAKGFLIAGS